jgi:YjbR
MSTADEVRQVALSLPEAEERETWGHPTFRVRDKLFATLSDDGLQAGIKTTKQEQTALIAAAPETFGVPAWSRAPPTGPSASRSGAGFCDRAVSRGRLAQASATRRRGRGCRW